MAYDGHTMAYHSPPAACTRGRLRRHDSAASYGDGLSVLAVKGAQRTSSSRSPRSEARACLCRAPRAERPSLEAANRPSATAAVKEPAPNPQEDEWYKEKPILAAEMPGGRQALRLGPVPCGRRCLCSFEQLPEQLKFNKYVLNGYRVDYRRAGCIVRLFWTRIFSAQRLPGPGCRRRRAQPAGRNT